MKTKRRNQHEQHKEPEREGERLLPAEAGRELGGAMFHRRKTPLLLRQAAEGRDFGHARRPETGRRRGLP